MYREIEKCRICGNSQLVSIIDFGNQYLTGIFPKTKAERVPYGPVELVKCQENKDGSSCGLLQLRQSYEPSVMYGSSYGYRSGLNRSMVNHLHGKVRTILDRFDVNPGDIVLDIGSNDGTLLQAYPHREVTLVGVDPTGEKFRKHYADHVRLISDFFSAQLFQRTFGGRKAKIVTSIAMFYDLEDPVGFMKEVREILADDGVWMFEQSYMPAMLELNAYDTICHEHLEYYGLQQIKWMTDRAGFKIIDIEFNDINGGSLSVMAAKTDSAFPEQTAAVTETLRREEERGLRTLEPYLQFRQRVHRHREELHRCINKIRSSNRLVLGYGASTKGNVILQFCQFSQKDIPFIAEVNEDKFGCYTPGTYIPIISEKEAKEMNPDYFLVLPWHFRANFLEREQEYLRRGGALLMPLPQIEVITRCGGQTPDNRRVGGKRGFNGRGLHGEKL